MSHDEIFSYSSKKVHSPPYNSTSGTMYFVAYSYITQVHGKPFGFHVSVHALFHSKFNCSTTIQLFELLDRSPDVI